MLDFAVGLLNDLSTQPAVFQFGVPYEREDRVHWILLCSSDTEVREISS
jgi:hypothetical protein